MILFYHISLKAVWIASLCIQISSEMESNARERQLTVSLSAFKPNNTSVFLVLTHRDDAIMAGIAKADITAILIGAVALTANVPAVTMRTALKDGTVIIARACARLGNAAVPIITSVTIRYVWEESVGIGNAIITNTANRDTTVSRREYAKRSVHQTALVRIPSAVQNTIQGRRTESAGISRNQKSGVCWRYCAVSMTLGVLIVGHTIEPASRIFVSRARETM